MMRVVAGTPGPFINSDLDSDSSLLLVELESFPVCGLYIYPTSVDHKADGMLCMSVSDPIDSPEHIQGGAVECPTCHSEGRGRPVTVDVDRHQVKDHMSKIKKQQCIARS